MQTEDTEVKIAPESLEVAQTYIQSLDIKETAKALELPIDVVVHHLEKREVKKFVDAVFFDRGYMNRHKLSSVIDNLIEKKLEELDEAEMGSSKDIAELVKLAIDFRSAELSNIIRTEKLSTPQKQQNIQINNLGDNYNHLIESIITGELVK